MDVDKHKIWLILSIVVVILIIGFVFIYPSVKEGLAGEAIKIGKSVDKAAGKSVGETIGKSIDIDSAKKVVMEICNDGIDNNDDGLVDCQEEACVSDQKCSPKCYKYTKFGKLDLSKFIPSTFLKEYPSATEYKSTKIFKYQFFNDDYSLLEQNACLKRMEIKYNDEYHIIT